MSLKPCHVSALSPCMGLDDGGVRPALGGLLPFAPFMWPGVCRVGWVSGGFSPLVSPLRHVNVSAFIYGSSSHGSAGATKGRTVGSKFATDVGKGSN